MPAPGIWKRKTEDLNLYGNGGFLVILYATILLIMLAQLDAGEALKDTLDGPHIARLASGPPRISGPYLLRPGDPFL